MVKMMDVHNVLYAYAILGDKIAAEWCENDIQIKQLAIGCEDLAKDLGPLTIAEAVAFFIDCEKLSRAS